jgi:hypothetical protein
MFEARELIEALETLGELMVERRVSADLLIAGGGALLLLGRIDRPTADIDVVALGGADGYRSAEPLPPDLVKAVAEVGEALELELDWLNNGPTALTDFGLPSGIETRVQIRTFGTLRLHLPAQQDLVAFKLYAAADQGERSKHFQDLVAMRPTPAELDAAASWARSHDPSEGFAGELERVQALVAAEVAEDG